MKTFIHGFDLIEKYFRVELKFRTYQTRFEFLAIFL